MTISRRKMLAGIASLPATLSIGESVWAKAVLAEGRPFSIEDYLRRKDIEAVIANRDGSVVALQVYRGLLGGGFHGETDALMLPRCDIWVADPGLGHPLKITEGHDWFSDPMFSVDGNTLSILAAGRDGQVSLWLWRKGERLARRSVANLKIEVAVTLSRVDGRRNPVAWLGPNAMLAVRKSGLYAGRPLSKLSSPRFEADVAESSREGKLSVRTWSTEDRRTCSPDNALVRIEPDTGRIRELFVGDVRAASVSPDGRRVAVVYATQNIKAIARDRMAGPVWPFGPGYEDLMVELGLQVIDLESGRCSGPAAGFEANSQMADDLYPIWADDSTRFALAARTSYSSKPEDSAAYVGFADSGGVRVERMQAKSPLDAVAIAHLSVATSSPEEARNRIATRPAYPVHSEMLTRHKGGSVVRVGSTVIVATESRLDILRAVSGKSVSMPVTIDGPFTAASDGAVFAVVMEEGRRSRIRISDDGHSLQPLAPLPSGVALTALLPSNGRQICVQNTDRDTRVLVQKASGRLEPAPFRLNEHFAEIRRPEAREINYSGADGKSRTGMLYMPTSDRKAQGGVPVVVFAYPNSVPKPDGALGKPNASSAWLVQPFLSAGYAVFHAAFPVADTTVANSPFKRVPEAVLPALDALDRTPGIATGRYGFYGQSNGGYAGLALGAQTDRFKAIIVAAAFPDWFDVDMAVTSEVRMLECAPSVLQSRRFYLEAPHVPYSIATSVVEGPQEFIANSPLYNLKHYKTPTLLVYGAEDVSLPPVEKMFLGLQTAGVDAELITFWGDGHVLGNPENIRHAVKRQVAWFDKYL